MHCRAQIHIFEDQAREDHVDRHDIRQRIVNVPDVKCELRKLYAETRLGRRHIVRIDVDPDDALDRRANQPLKTVASGAPSIARGTCLFDSRPQ
jgi:hypothetical protein